MHFLFFLLVPAAFVYYLTGYRDVGTVGNKTGYLAGIAVGIVAILVNLLVSLFFPQTTAVFAVKFIGVLLTETVIPYILGPIALYYLFVTTQGACERLSRMRIHVFGIATVYLPYIMVTRYDVPDMAVTLGVPVMLLSALFLAEYCIRKYVASVRKAPDMIDFVLSLLPVFGLLIVTDLYKTLWFYCFPGWIYIPLFFILPTLASLPRIRAYR